MDRRRLLGSLASALAWPAEAQAAPTPAKLTGELQALMAHAEAKGFCGQVELSIRGVPALSGAWGWADAAKALPLTPRDRFHIASISKLLTATAVLKALEAGRLSLSDPVRRFFPDAPPDKAGITVEQLLTHTSGIPQAYAADGSASRDAAVRAILSTPLDFAPGSGTRYSNDGMTLAGALLERATATPYMTFVRRNVFDAVPMRDTLFWAEVDERSTPRLAAVLGEDGPHADGTLDWGMIGGNGIWSTARDLAAFMTALANGRILGARTLELLSRPRVYDDGDWTNLGWFTRADPGKAQLLWMRGTEGNGHNAALYWYPQHQSILGITTNGGFEHDRVTVSRALADEIEARLPGVVIGG